MMMQLSEPVRNLGDPHVQRVSVFRDKQGKSECSTNGITGSSPYLGKGFYLEITQRKIRKNSYCCSFAVKSWRLSRNKCAEVQSSASVYTFKVLSLVLK